MGMHWTWRADSASFRHNSKEFVPRMGWVLASNVAFLGPQFGVSLLGWKFACSFLSIGDPQYSMTTPHGRLGRLVGLWLALSRSLEDMFSPLVISGFVRGGGGEHSRWHLCHWSLSCIENGVKCSQTDRSARIID
jgi:hypothetical protein